jgi:hypothetical protein
MDHSFFQDYDKGYCTYWSRIPLKDGDEVFIVKTKQSKPTIAIAIYLYHVIGNGFTRHFSVKEAPEIPVRIELEEAKKKSGKFLFFKSGYQAVEHMRNLRIYAE